MDNPIYLKVRVFPNSKKEEVHQKMCDEFVVKVREKAEQGRANQRVKELLSEHLGIPEERLVLIRGASNAHKIYKVIIRSE